jgi:hypothetical protein
MGSTCCRADAIGVYITLHQLEPETATESNVTAQREVDNGKEKRNGKLAHAHQSRNICKE